MRDDDGGASTILVKAAPYQPGTITAHQEQAKLHGRKKATGRRQMQMGTGAATAGVLTAAGAPGIGDTAHRLVSQNSRNLPSGMRAVKAARVKVTATKVASRGGLGLAAAGAGLAGVGSYRAAHHGYRQNMHTQAAQAARQQRNAQLAKAHDDGGASTILVKSDRTRRASSAALGGAAVGAAAGARQDRRRAVAARGAADLHSRRAEGNLNVAQDRLERLGRGGNGTLPATAHNVAGIRGAVKVGRSAQRQSSGALHTAVEASHRARGKAGAAAGLAAGSAFLATRRREPRQAYPTVGYR